MAGRRTKQRAQLVRCPDHCGLRPERWHKRRSGRRGTWMECKECGRFIGYVDERPKGGRAK